MTRAGTTRSLRRIVLNGAAFAVCIGATASLAQAAPISGDAAAGIQRIVDNPRYGGSLWAIEARDVQTGEVVYDNNGRRLMAPGSVTKLFQAAALFESYGADHRFRTPVHAIGSRQGGRLRGPLVLVASGDSSFGLRERPGDRLEFEDGGTDHNEANSLGLTTSLSGNPLRALNRLARDVRRSGIRRASDVVVDDRLFITQRTWPDGPIPPVWVNENLIDILVRPTQLGRPAKMGWRPRTPAWRVVSTVTTGRETDLDVEQDGPRTVTISGTIARGSGATVRTFSVPDPQAFARTAFIQALARAGVRIDAPRTGRNPVAKLPHKRRLNGSNRVGQWTSPPISEYVKVTLKTSYNRGADLMACLVGVRVGFRDCDRGLARATAIARRLGVPGTEFFNFDGAGSDDRNRHAPNALNALNTAAASRPWSADYRAALPVLGVPGGGSLAFSGQDSPARGKLAAKTGTRAGVAPGAIAVSLEARSFSGYLTTSSGRELVVAIMVNNIPLQQFFPDFFDVNNDLVSVVNELYSGT